MQNTLIAILLGFGVLQGAFISFILLFLKKGNIKANIALMALVFSITSIIFQNFIVFSGVYKMTPHLSMPFLPMNGLIGPTFYFFVLFLIYPNRSFKLYDLLHSIPFFILVFRHSWFYNLSAADTISVIE